MKTFAAAGADVAGVNKIGILIRTVFPEMVTKSELVGVEPKEQRLHSVMSTVTTHFGQF